MQIPAEVAAEQALEIASRQTQHVVRPWWDNDDVLLNVRNTSVGDILETEGNSNGDAPILAWDDAQPDDLVGIPTQAFFA